MSILVNVVNQKMYVSSNADGIVAGSQQFVKFKFNLSKEWDGLMVFAQFRQGTNVYNKYLDDDRCVYLPAEIVAGTCTMMLYGSYDVTIGTTNYLTFKIGENNLVSDATSTEISQSLYDQLITMVQQNNEEIAIERARITNLSKLQDGSTTGDAELQDIRVGYDGKTYATAGEAVRAQFGYLHNAKLPLHLSINTTSGEGKLVPDMDALSIFEAACISGRCVYLDLGANAHIPLTYADREQARFEYLHCTPEGVYTKRIAIIGRTVHISETSPIDDNRISTGFTLSSKTIVDKLCPAFTESGAIITCEPVEGYHLGVVSQIVPVQEGSGDPHPGSHVGVNIDGIKNNANWTVEDRDDHYEYHYILNVALSPGTYTAKYKASEREDFDFIHIMIEECENLATSLYPGDDITITQDADNNISKILVDIYAPQKLPDNIALYGDVLQVFELAEVKEPNIRPIVGCTDVKLTRCGKNLLSEDWRDWSNWPSQRYELNLPTGNYVVSATKKADNPAYLYLQKSVDGGNTWDLAGSPSGYIMANTTVRSVSFTVSAGEKWALWSGEGQFKSILTIQVEIGKTKTAYEPYKGDIFTVELGQTVYGGSYNWKTGELTITHGFYTMTGQETFRLYDNYFVAYNDGAFKASVANEGLCSHGSYANYRTGCWCVNGAVVYVPNGNYGLDDTGLQVFQEDIATWYELSYPVQLCYKLAQPITIQATPQEVLALQGVNTLFSNTGDTTVSGKADPTAINNHLQKRLAALEAAIVNNT